MDTSSLSPSFSQHELDVFVSTIKAFYRSHKRVLPWRENITPYGVVISEIMLQQTQVSRVLVKYPDFITQFPHFESLANAPFDEILRRWKGMGYNRRALYLKKISKMIVEVYNNVVPRDPVILDTFPGIGHATAHSIATFIYNKPHIFIETNIRRVFIHHFFTQCEYISDADILPLVQRTIDYNNPREWYYALMDYGSYLATQIDNPNRKSKHYTRQSVFEGSNRQLRGKILALLLRSHMNMDQLQAAAVADLSKIEILIAQLQNEGFVVKDKGDYSIRKEEKNE